MGDMVQIFVAFSEYLNFTKTFQKNKPGRSFVKLHKNEIVLSFFEILEA